MRGKGRKARYTHGSNKMGHFHDKALPEYHDRGMAYHRPSPVLCGAMKKSFLLLASTGCISALCAQTAVTVSTHPGTTDQVWYSLENGEAGRAALSEWDLAFEMTGFTSSIRVNAAKGLITYETPDGIGDWDNVTSPDTANWTIVQNSDSSWSVGALNHGNDLANPDGVNVGWGIYNMVTHVIAGNRIYVIQSPDGTFRKLRIDALSAGVFHFTYANLDGSNSHDATLVKSNFTGKNFGYYSFDTNSASDREPATAAWDLLFSKYHQLEPYPYTVVGVLQNKAVTALQVDGVPTGEADWTSAPFQVNMNVLGADWKQYDMDQNAYTIVPDRTYFVKDVPGNIWKIVFSGYGGSAAGDISFNQELVSAVGVMDVGAAKGRLFAWPNPVANGRAQLVLDVPANEGVLRVLNTSGQELLRQRMTGLSGLAGRTLDTGNLAKGVYILRFDAAYGNTTGKLIVE